MPITAVGLSSEVDSVPSLLIRKTEAALTTRTEECEVRAIIDTEADVSLNFFMENANVVVDDIAAKASELGITVTSARLKLIETYLSAHFYALFDQQPHEEDTGKAKSMFQGKTEMYFDSTLWGQQAVALDPTNSLRGGPVVSATWLGTERV